MSNEILDSLLKEYSQKKLKAEMDLEKRKENLYLQIPELQKIEDKLNTFAIETTKNILNNKSSLDELSKTIESLKTEKIRVLKEENIDYNFLKPYYECSICDDTGYILVDNYKTQMCNCLKQKLLDHSFNESNIYSLNNENFDNFNENIFSDVVNFKKYNYNISPRENILNIKEKCINFVENFDDIGTKNLLFTGNTGLRKNFHDKLYC